MVATALVSLLVGLALFNATKAISQNSVIRAAQMLQTDLQQAYAIASRNRKPVVLRWSSSLVEMQVTDRAQTTVYRRSALGARSGFKFQASDVTVYPTVLTVFPHGLAADTFYVRLSKNGFTRTLRMSRGGIVRLQ